MTVIVLPIYRHVMQGKGNIKISWAQPDIYLEDFFALRESVESKWISQGPKVAEFESLIASVSQRKYCVALNSGTSALLAVLTALGASPGNEVIIPAMSFIAVPYAVSRCGALPVLADLDRRTGVIRSETVLPCISKRTIAVIAIEYSGFANDWTALSGLCQERGITLIIDAASSFLATCKSRPAGSFGEAAIFSFHAAKPFTTGEGGAVVTDNQEMATLLRRIRDYGQVPGEKYAYDVFGGNYRMTDLSASMGLSQLRRADQILERRRQVMKCYLEHEVLNSLALPGYKDDESRPNGFTFTLLYEHREQLRTGLQARGIETRVMWPLCVDQQPVYKDLSLRRVGETREARDFSSSTLSLPVHSGLGESEMEYILRSLDKLLTSTGQ